MVENFTLEGGKNAAEALSVILIEFLFKSIFMSVLLRLAGSWINPLCTKLNAAVTLGNGEDLLVLGQLLD